MRKKWVNFIKKTLDLLLVHLCGFVFLRLFFSGREFWINFFTIVRNVRDKAKKGYLL